MKITPHQRAELRSHSVYLTRRQRHCAWQRTRFVRSLIGCTIMLAAPHVLRQRARRPQRPRSNCPAAVVVSLPTSGSAPQPGRMSNRVDISALWRMYYRWHRLRLRDARVRERRRHVLRPRHIPRARATRSAICKVRWQWRHTAALLPTSRQQSLRTSGASSHARCVLRMRECARHADSVARLPRAQRALHLATCVTKRRCDVVRPGVALRSKRRQRARRPRRRPRPAPRWS
mmetsp:Transcript_30381/g.91103  ORF Transcript_30381/g.91103 Transcript_30381/m.91103 type:complete len:232 (+) Transcript_30381:754-1449(+)